MRIQSIICSFYVLLFYGFCDLDTLIVGVHNGPIMEVLSEVTNHRKFLNLTSGRFRLAADKDFPSSR